MGHYTTELHKKMQWRGFIINSFLLIVAFYLIFTPEDVIGWLQTLVGSYLFQVYMTLSPYYYGEFFKSNALHPSDEIKQLLALRKKVDDDLKDLGYRESD